MTTIILISKFLIIQSIHTYQIFISPLIKPSCRFQTKCSEYGINAINNFGTLKGILMLIKRILKCHPF